jgi:hypothetical protein
MITLRNEDDFKRYKHRLDIGEKYEHEHIGEPVRYPAKVESRDCDDGNTRASYQLGLCAEHKPMGATLTYMQHALWMDEQYKRGYRQTRCHKCRHYLFRSEM